MELITNPIESVIVMASINELFATTEIKQTFWNNQKTNLEITVIYPLNKAVILKSFTAKMGDKTVHSKIMKKEKAEEKYSDSIASGNTGILGSYSEDSEAGTYNVTIGNLAAGESLILTSEFIQLITQEDKSYEYKFSLANFPKIITLKNKNNENKENIPTMFIAQLKTNSKITRLISPSHLKFLIREIKENINNQVADIDISPDGMKTNKKEITILFRTEEMNKFKLIEQYDPLLKNYAYSLQLMLDQRETNLLKKENSPQEIDLDDTKSYYQLYEANEINETPGVFIFLVDQSGSMGGNSIKIAEESIKLFLQSLPSNSYFDIIGFGSSLKSYSTEPLFYNSKNVAYIMTKIKSLQANLGGTNIYSPLEFIYKRNYNNSLSKTVFLLTDGEVDDSQKCFDLIKKNCNNFRVHALGIGNSVDKNFIEGSGQAGKGSSLFAPLVDNLRKLVIQALNSALRPYLNNLKIKINENDVQVKRQVEYPSSSANNLIYNDEIFTYSFVSNEKLKESALIKVSAFDPIKNLNFNNEFTVKDILYSLENGNSLNKAIVGSFIKNCEGLISKEEIVKLSTQFQVASKETSLFAEVLKDNSIQTEILKFEVRSKKSEREAGEIYRNAPMMRMKSAIPRMSAMPQSPNIANNAIMNIANIYPDFKLKGKCSVMKKCVNNSFKANTKKQSARSNLDDKFSMELDEDLCSQNMEIDSFKMEVFNISGNSISQTLLTTDLNTEYFYNEIISAQNMFDGSWNVDSLPTKSVINKYQELYSKLETYLKNQENLNISDNATIAVTILIVFFLNKELSHKKEEYLLIVNKAKKYLRGKGVDFDTAVENISQ